MTTPETSPTAVKKTSGMADPTSSQGSSEWAVRRISPSRESSLTPQRGVRGAYDRSLLRRAIDSQQRATDPLQERERVVGDRLGDVIDAAGFQGQVDVAPHGVGRDADDGDGRPGGVALEEANQAQPVHAR